MRLVDEGLVIRGHTNIRDVFSPGVEITFNLLDGVEDDYNTDNEDNNNSEGDGEHYDKVLVDILYSSFINNHVLSLFLLLFSNSVRSNRIIHCKYFVVGIFIGRLGVVKVTCYFPRLPPVS